MIPETDKVSCVTTVIAEVASCVSRVKAARRLPTMLVATTKNGTIASDNSVSGTDSSSMATMALMNVTPLLKMFESVVVTAPWTPPTSLVMRLCRSPVRADE